MRRLLWAPALFVMSACTFLAGCATTVVISRSVTAEELKRIVENLPNSSITDTSRAYKVYRAALEEDASTSNTLGVVTSLVNLAALAMKNDNAETAAQLYSQAFDLAAVSAYPMGAFDALVGLGDARRTQKQYSAALVAYDKAERLATKSLSSGLASRNAVISTHRALTLIDQGQYAQAREQYKKLLEETKRAQTDATRQLLAALTSQVALLSFRMGNNDEALTYFREAHQRYARIATVSSESLRTVYWFAKTLHASRSDHEAIALIEQTLSGADGFEDERIEELKKLLTEIRDGKTG